MEEVLPEDERAVENIRQRCITPGVVYADRVIVQSEGMRRIYIDILTEKFGEGTRGRWEQKILGLGSPKTDWMRKERKETPPEWDRWIKRENGESKKIVLYATSASVLLQKKTQALEKMRNVFAAFQEQKEELALLWAPDAYVQETLGQAHPQLLGQYKKLMEEFLEEGVGICDCSGDFARAASLCDAFYGDRGYAMELCLLKGVPVMIQETEILL